ncbi:hypothetical protein AVO45_13505 [Ruegeria marisrubri]|uniref:Uncharacterized protein n=1 Tax=Ruegeria marisrubri TaxID=1685379 RepID=A0A0X3TCV4_9RHOB|nr:hypothetical protein [Ruegeria marisrubri]KUJ73615.1 hypothetical protein AVO45_13505 [Ruegeria marisrubri]
MSARPFALTLALAAALPLCAQAGNESRSKAYQLDSGLIEVIADFSENAIYWCGAGDYALTRLKKPANQRLYVWKGPSASTAQPGERAVTFGFERPPGAAEVSTLTNDVKLIGNSLSVAQAKKTCDERTASG